MTKKEIVKAISVEMEKLTQLETKKVVQMIFDAIIDTLVEEKRIELRNFGVFEVKRRAARKARNPRTGQRVDVPAKWVVTFKPGKEMEQRVRQLEIEEEAKRAAAAPETQDTEAAARQVAATPDLTDRPAEQGPSEAAAAPETIDANTGLNS